ncbi:MAG: alpha/beta hydrolase [Alphaproteobacteria bacterium]|jgi:pimeloyl-ACP methyl ester carboxylesterase|nr:alpha/beta hydrolase [Alphaproteobacteria bacterium]
MAFQASPFLGPWVRRVAFAGSALALAGCSIPGPDASEADMAARVPRHDLPLSAGYSLSYLEAGAPSGRLAIFVHGTPGDAHAWADYLIGVPKGFRYVAIDRPGFGHSGPDGAVVSLAEQAQAIAALIRANGGKPAVLIGHSLGGPIIAQAAVDSPDLVAALVVLAGSLDPAQENVPFIQYVGDTWPVSALLPRWLRNTNREIIALEPQLEALAPRLATIHIPVTIVHGTKDDLVPFENVAFMKTHLTGTHAMDVTVIDGQNHFLPWNSKQQVDAAIAKAFAMMEAPTP